MAVARFDVRMVILVVGHKSNRVDEAQRVAKIREFEVLDDGQFVLGQLPAGQSL